jgi:3-hydroxyisobutyrate dehydrogenase-like beta-hydroxyacid dehydrogenase
MEAKAVRMGFMGFGEAGWHFAKGLAQGGLTGMVAYSRSGARAQPGDPLYGRAREAGVELVKSPRELCRRADLIMAVTQGRSALAALRSVRRHLRPGHVYVDASAAAVKSMEKGAELVGTAAAFGDAAILGPVPVEGLRVLILASGPGAAPFRDALAPYGMNVRVIDGPPGAASALKLIRSVFMKGITGLLLESMEAAERYGIRAALETDIARWIDERPFSQVINRFVGSTAVHAERRMHEMDDVLALLRELKSSTRMTRATHAWFREMGELGLGERWGGKIPETIAPVVEALAARGAAK